MPGWEGKAKNGETMEAYGVDLKTKMEWMNGEEIWFAFKKKNKD